MDIRRNAPYLYAMPLAAVTDRATLCRSIKPAHTLAYSRARRASVWCEWARIGKK